MTFALLLAALSFAAPAETAPAETAPLARDLHGEQVRLSEDPAVLVFWSMDCTSCAEALRALSQAEVTLVAINTDPVQRHSQIEPWLKRQGLALQVVVDDTGALQRQYGVQAGQGMVLTAEDGRVSWRSEQVLASAMPSPPQLPVTAAATP